MTTLAPSPTKRRLQRRPVPTMVPERSKIVGSDKLQPNRVVAFALIVSITGSDIFLYLTKLRATPFLQTPGNDS
jgi:hypothetical protein